MAIKVFSLEHFTIHIQAASGAATGGSWAGAAATGGADSTAGVAAGAAASPAPAGDETSILRTESRMLLTDSVPKPHRILRLKLSDMKARREKLEFCG